MKPTPKKFRNPLGVVRQYYLKVARAFIELLLVIINLLPNFESVLKDYLLRGLQNEK
jgi:hypothetical protein